MDAKPYGFYLPTPEFKQASPHLQYIYMREHYRMVQRELAESQLRFFMPRIFICVYALLVTLLSVAMIALEIASIITNTAIYYVVGGIWGGLYGIFVAVFSLFLIKNRTFLFFVLAITFNSIAIIIFFLGFDVINAVGLGIYSLCDSRQIACPFDINMRPITIAKLVVGIICNLLPLIFVIYVPIRVFCHTQTTKRALRAFPSTSAASPKF